MKGTLTSAQKQAFCRAYLKTMDPQRAAAEIGAENGWTLLRSRSVRQCLETLRAAGGAQILREDVVRRLCELAFGRANDAVALALSPSGERPDPQGLDLSAVSEFKVTDKGGVEIRFTDRVEALEALGTLLGPDAGDAAEFFRALEDSGAETEEP